MTLDEVVIRAEEPADYARVENLTREAFWNVYAPGCDEHFLLRKLRQSPGFLPDMHLLAVYRGEILGSIAYSRSHVAGESGKIWDTLCFGPLSVMPARQRQGIGSLLVRRSLDMARQRDERAVVIFGSPAYYGRFGFRPAGSFGISTAEGETFDAFMALELCPGALSGVSGRYHHDAAFDHIDPNEVAAYDSAFPPKVKLKLPGQLA